MNGPFDFQDLETLIAHQGKPAVSIYIPTTRITTRVQAESLQFKNLVREAENELEQFDLRGPTIRAILEPARELITDSEFWRHLQDGLAVFLSEDNFFRYPVPMSFETTMIVAESYHVKPLIPLLTNDGLFYILAVSQNAVRVLRCTRFTVSEIDPATIPNSLAEILSEYDIEKQVQYHTSSSAPGVGRRGGIYFGQGGNTSDEEKEKLREFFERIDRGLREYLQEQNAPLVFAGVEYLFPIYREANTYPNLVESNITGNPETLRAEELQREAWKIIEPIFSAKQTASIEEYHNLVAHGRTGTRLEELLPAADQGRVDTAFVAKNESVWGTYDPETQRAEVHKTHTPQNRDLTDLFAIYTLLRKGSAYVLSNADMLLQFGVQKYQEVNQEKPLEKVEPVAAAIYRY